MARETAITARLTPAQVADLLAVAPSTLRRWSVEFADHLSPGAKPRKGQKRSYTAEDLAALRRASDLLRAGKAPAEVAGLLAVAPRPEDLTGLEVATVPELARDLADAREGLRQLAEDLKATREAQAQGRAELEETRKKVADLEARLQAWEGLGFFDRLLGRKPKV